MLEARPFSQVTVLLTVLTSFPAFPQAANYCLFKLAALTPDTTEATEGDGGAGAAGPEGPAAPAAPKPAAAATASASASTARQLAADAAAKGLRQLISHPVLGMLVDWEPQLRVLAQIVERVKVTEVLAAALEVFGQLVTVRVCVGATGRGCGRVHGHQYGRSKHFWFCHDA